MAAKNPSPTRKDVSLPQRSRSRSNSRSGCSRSTRANRCGRRYGADGVRLFVLRADDSISTSAFSDDTGTGTRRSRTHASEPDAGRQHGAPGARLARFCARRESCGEARARATTRARRSIERWNAYAAAVNSHYSTGGSREFSIGLRKSVRGNRNGDQ
jgi:hypothetical protein